MSAFNQLCILLKTTTLCLMLLFCSSQCYALNETLSFERAPDGSWIIVVRGLQTNANPLCEGIYSNDLRIDYAQSPPLIDLYLNPDGPIPIGVCSPLATPRAYASRFSLNRVGALAPGLYRVRLLDGLATAFLDTRPPPVPTTSALGLLSLAAALAVAALAGVFALVKR
jgi:hypothetical protein